ncbi:MAG: ABC transporter permease, partial [Gemmatimonadota bacterium]
MAGTASASTRRSTLAPYLLVGPGVLWLILFYLLPTIALARTSVKATPWWDGYVRAFTDYGDHLVRSFGFAAAATLAAFLLGYPL